MLRFAVICVHLCTIQCIQSDVMSVPYTNHHKREVPRYQEQCRARETEFLSDLKRGRRLATKHTFLNGRLFSLAMAWTSSNNQESLIAVTAKYFLGSGASSVWRGADHGRTWTQTDHKIDNDIIRKGNGLQKNPFDSAFVYLVPYGNYMYVTEDGGETFKKRVVVEEGGTVTGYLIFHSDERSRMVMVISDSKRLFATVNNFEDMREIAENVDTAKWGEEEPDAIYALIGNATHQSSFYGGVKSYTLVKYANIDSRTPITLKTNVKAFGLYGTILYASVYSQDKRSISLLVSNNRGETWHEAQLPTLADTRFFSVMDMSEGFIFMHVDDPGDTGFGTLYTSGKAGVVYSESLQRHLYPNYASVTDFYKVESMRGVYLASQLNEEDKSIHTMITFNRGGIWQPIPLSREDCKDRSQVCQLQIHNQYSISRGVKARPPLSIKTAPGLILVHGHAGNSLQTSSPDVYITTDGGYNWRKTLEGPHYYQIADSGGLLVAVPTSDSKATHVKFSTDEGTCWHDYQFTNESIYFTGLLTEPGGKSMTVSIWGYTADEHRKWVVHVISFADVISRECDDSDYVLWMPHSDMRREELMGVEGCLLGVREAFKKPKPESWCRNVIPRDDHAVLDTCRCTRGDYECDYGYHRQASSGDCVKDPGFSGNEIDICLRDHEEEIATEGYRKIPGDMCKGDVHLAGRKIDLSVKCRDPTEPSTNVSTNPSTNVSTNPSTNVSTLPSTKQHSTTLVVPFEKLQSKSWLGRHWYVIAVPTLITVIPAVCVTIFAIHHRAMREGNDGSFQETKKGNLTIASDRYQVLYDKETAKD